MRVGAVLLSLLAALMVAVPATAAPGQISLQSDVPIAVEGAYQTAAEGTFLLEGDAGQVALLVDGQTGTLERIVHRAYGHLRPEDPEAGIMWEQRVERSELPLENAYVTLDERLPGFTLLAWDAEATMARSSGVEPLHISLQQDSRFIRSEAEPPIQLVVGETQSSPFEHTLVRGEYQARSLASLTTLTGPLDLYIGDAVLKYHGDGEAQNVLAHFRTEEKPGAIFDPIARSWTGPGTHTEYIHEYLILHIAEGRVQVQHQGVPALLHSKAPAVAVTGTALFPAAVGMVTIEEETGTIEHELDGEDLRLSGRFTFDLVGATLQDPRSDVTGQGDLTQVSYAKQDHAYDWTSVAVATGISTIILAAVAWFSGIGKWLVGSISSVGGLLTGYARVHGDEILQHDGRSQVYDRVKATPGMHFMDLLEQVPFGASTLNYHLRVLERNDFVSRVKDGRYARFFDRRSGEYSSDRKQAASTLRNDTTAAIASHIIHNPGIVQRDLAAHFGIAASTVSWHVGRLQDQDLVEKERDHHFTRYYMGAGWSQLPTAELTRVGVVA